MSQGCSGITKLISSSVSGDSRILLDLMVFCCLGFWGFEGFPRCPTIIMDSTSSMVVEFYGVSGVRTVERVLEQSADSKISGIQSGTCIYFSQVSLGCTGSCGVHSLVQGSTRVPRGPGCT